ncbi:hypothetical protein BDV28DRAFT_147688 [Aspergillus coremiiformis]|uniref:Uncharacterized protein n=1 Tax=Aspergillus coremiiformis TaxID=138285 RepID=A0A5N6Z9J0_9EURO|nr:hypothetical protein BDV28DRAFT_147688 [Aspergillus coremiiformis]
MADLGSDPFCGEQVISGSQFQTSEEFCAHVYNAILQGLPDQVLVYTDISADWGNEAIVYLDDLLDSTLIRKAYNSFTREFCVVL